MVTRPWPSPVASHRLTVRFGLTAVDQSVSSLSNFAVGIAAAHVAGVAGLGAYSLVYAVWLLVAALHRSLVTDPMAIENDLRQADPDRHVTLGLAAEITLGLATAVLFAGGGLLLLGLGQRPFGVSFLCLAPWLPCLLAQDYWRWVGFMASAPEKALANDLVFDAVQAATFAALFLSGVHSSVVAVGAWGVGAAAGALYGLHQFACRPSLRGGLARIRRRWAISRWLVAGNATSAATTQSTVVLTGAFLGPAGIGGLKAATSLISGPSLVLVQAGGSIGLPEASRALREQGWPGLRRVERVVAAAGMAGVGLVGLVVVGFGRQLLVAIYGPAFARFAAAADVLALAAFATSCSLGAILSLKATRRSQHMLPATIAAVVVSVVTVVLLAPRLGVLGAAFATLIPCAVRTLGLLATHWTVSRPAAEAIYRAEGAPAPAAGPLHGAAPHGDGDHAAHAAHAARPAHARGSAGGSVPEVLPE